MDKSPKKSVVINREALASAINAASPVKPAGKVFDKSSQKNSAKTFNKTSSKTSQKTSWGGVAKWYDDLVEAKGTYQSDLILPNLLRLVAPTKGDKILDIACGQGFFSRAFAEKGAAVAGVDISAELIAIARKNSPKELSFFVAPADKLDFAKDGTYDKACIVLALQNIENLADSLTEAARTLKKSGRLALVLNHPAFRVPKRSSWEWDEAARKQYRRIDAYMSETNDRIDMNPGAVNAASKKMTVSFHRPLQSYFKALGKAGFAVTRLEEWISDKKSNGGPRGAEEDRTRKEFPMFLYLEAVKM
jgi:ubiquinone/menaquinone biosynthesis C-methylase UbiE